MLKYVYCNFSDFIGKLWIRGWCILDEKIKIYDIMIIGGGLVGLFVVFYVGMCNVSVKIIESLL